MESSVTLQSTTDMTSDLSSNMADHGKEDEATDEAGLYKIVNFLYTYVYVIIIVTGVIGNTFCLIILSKPKIRQTSVSLYLFVLAAIDSLVLFLDFLNNFFIGVLHLSIIGINKVTCNLYMFFFNVAFTYSSWLVVAITFERTLAVCIPIKASRITSRKKAKITSLVIFVLVAGFLGFNLFAWDARDSDSMCVPAKGWESFHHTTNMWLMGFSYSYIPSFILLICNTLIVYQLTKASRVRRTMKYGPEPAGTKSDTTKITITVLFVSVAFLLLTAPLSAFYLVQFSMGQMVDMTPQMALGEAVMLMLGLGNHGINFWIYMITSAQYRNTFLGLWPVCCNKKDITGSDVSNTASTAINTRESTEIGTNKTDQHGKDSIQTVS